MILKQLVYPANVSLQGLMCLVYVGAPGDPGVPGSVGPPGQMGQKG